VAGDEKLFALCAQCGRDVRASGSRPHVPFKDEKCATRNNYFSDIALKNSG
jgi:endogenous inhibitor of DNA gyrase (YacG/DUF329 family)